MQSGPSILNDIFSQEIKATTSDYFYNHVICQLVVFSRLSLTWGQMGSGGPKSLRSGKIGNHYTPLTKANQFVFLNFKTDINQPFSSTKFPSSLWQHNHLFQWLILYILKIKSPHCIFFLQNACYVCGTHPIQKSIIPVTLTWVKLRRCKYEWWST